MGIEPTSQPWEGRILPLYYDRKQKLALDLGICLPAGRGRTSPSYWTRSFRRVLPLPARQSFSGGGYYTRKNFFYYTKYLENLHILF